MKFALLLADWPMHLLPNPGLDAEWQALQKRVQGVLESKPPIAPGIKEIHAGAWLIPVDGGLRALNAMCQAVDGQEEQMSWGYRVLFFEEKPEWIKSPATHC
jgi:hypothetical protein